LPSLQKALPPRGLTGFRDVDSAEDPSAYVAFLDGFAQSFAEMIGTGIDALRLAPGASVFDLGCGHGAAFPPIASRVGASGRIVGLDASRALIAEAHRRFDGTLPRVELHCGDAHALPLPDAAFEAARADRVLIFLRDPRAALAELVRVTKPGGRIVVTEGDLGTSAVDVGDVETTRAILAAAADEMPNGWIGRQVRAMFVDAGLDEVDVRLFTVQGTSFAEWRGRMGMERAVRRAVDRNGVSASAADAWLAELGAREAAGRFFATSMFFMASGTRRA
jgi:ubiquinone/menaquinone biosynthesis C-methylase UbiE